MGRCKDCKHYRPDRRIYSDDKRPSPTCENPVFFIGYHHEMADMPPDGLWIEDDEGWAWIVGPEFGCIHFEQREGT